MRKKERKWLQEEGEESFEEVAESSETQEESTIPETSMADMSNLIGTTGNKSLNKIMTYAYKKAGTLINAVYIARPGDTLSSISEKIYGSSQEDTLKSLNSHLAEREVVVGDKIYYNSPNRPNDNSKILYYFDDIKAPALSHQVSPGDNIQGGLLQALRT